MSTPLHELLRADARSHGLAKDEDLIRSVLHEFRCGARSTSEFQQQPTLIPERALTGGELRALERVGMLPDECALADASCARQKSLYSFFTTYQSGYSAKDVAAMLGVTPSRIRQRVRERTLAALTGCGEMRFPSLQFEGGSEIPGLREVLPSLSPEIKVLELLSWLATPAAELGDKGRPRSPREYLLETGDVSPVIELGRALRRGEAS